MYREYFADNPIALLGIVPLIFFFIAFIGILLWSRRYKSADATMLISSLPLSNDSEPTCGDKYV